MAEKNQEVLDYENEELSEKDCWGRRIKLSGAYGSQYECQFSLLLGLPPARIPGNSK